MEYFFDFVKSFIDQAQVLMRCEPDEKTKPNAAPIAPNNLIRVTIFFLKYLSGYGIVYLKNMCLRGNRKKMFYMSKKLFNT